MERFPTKENRKRRMDLVDSNGAKQSVRTAPFGIQVLGGKFYVSEVFLLDDETREQVVDTIKGIPEDRWFVMVSDTEDEHNDALAMIDDDLEFQIFAHGRLVQE